MNIKGARLFQSIGQAIDRYPLGLIVVLIISIITSTLVLLRKDESMDAIQVWLFDPEHQKIFTPVAEEWNDDPLYPNVDIQMVELRSLSRRMLSGFMSGTPIADLILAERQVASQAWRGPLEAIGFFDITDRVHSEDLFHRINRASFAPWTVQGRIFGLPMDVHPVMLSYRSDLYEAAGIPIETARTWDEFMEMSKPLIGDLNGDGVQDRFILEVPQNSGHVINMLMLQAGSDLFNNKGSPTINSEINNEVMTQLVYWAVQPEAYTMNLPLFTGSSERLRSDGLILAWLTPDWRAARNMQNIPGLYGKLKLMPLPRWTENGARTSVWGGTMFGLNRESKRLEDAWDFIKKLYFDRSVAREMWREIMVVSPVVEFWDDPVYDEPMAYYSNQKIGRLFVELASEVPERSSSVYYPAAVTELGNVLSRTVQLAKRSGIAERDGIRELVEKEMAVAQRNVSRILERNIFAENK